MATTTKRKNISPDLKAYIAQTVQEILDDPDFGLELTERAKKRLRAVRRENGKGISLADARKKYY